MKNALLACLAILTLILPATAEWKTDFTAAKTEAKRDGKPILLDFTGSDWCGWCVKMKKDVLNEKAFKDFSDKSLVLVEVDFPQKKAQTAALKKANSALQDKYKVGGFPTFVLINADGKELGRHEGYLKGGPAAFIQKIEGWTKAAK